MSNEASKLIVGLQEENTELKIKVIDLDKKVFELEAQLPKWISVEDELPDEGVDVLVFPIKMHLGDEPVYNSHLRDGSWIYIWAGAIYNVYPRVTHWMPLPQPPKEQGHE